MLNSSDSAALLNIPPPTIPDHDAELPYSNSLRLNDVLYVPTLNHSLFSWNVIKSKAVLVARDNSVHIFNPNDLINPIFVADIRNKIPWLRESPPTAQSAHMSHMSPPNPQSAIYRPWISCFCSSPLHCRTAQIISIISHRSVHFDSVARSIQSFFFSTSLVYSFSGSTAYHSYHFIRGIVQDLSQHMRFDYAIRQIHASYP